ncbi:MAG: FAD-binding oxidoreductase [Candidatus Omnitrophica bacterium]|nr:FAD-binding oxidoreductase [Candidatus Omnitrophota bacterium]
MNPPLENYLKDASLFRGKAERACFPSTEKEISQLLKEANQKKIPITVSGAGTGLTGARVPQGGTVLSMERLNRILKIEWDDSAGSGFAVVQPGVILKDLQEALEPRGLFYPPNPGETAAFIGGTVATNASGSRSFKYGPTRRYVRRLRMILPNGEPLELSRGQTKAEGGTLSIRLSNGVRIQIPIPTYSMPPVKNTAGYFTAPDMDLIDLFIGSEGTLGVFTEIELAVLKKPEAVVGGLLFFDSEKECARFTWEARRIGRAESAGTRLDPRLLEFFDSRSLKLLLKKHPRIPKEAGAALFFEQETQAGQEDSVHQPWGHFAPIPKEFRHDLPVLVNEQVALNGFRKIGTDFAVPDAKAEAMLDFYLEILGKSGIDTCLFGHLGDNNLHANLLPKTQEEFDRSKGIYDLLARKAVELGGTVSAEHGIGKVRIPYLEMMIGRRGLEEMARVKRALDPNGILSPGNIVPVELLHAAHGSINSP